MRSEGMRRGLVAALAGLALAAVVTPAAAAADTDDARAFVQATIDQVMGILKNGSLPLEQKKNDVEEIAYERFEKKPLLTRMQCRTCIFDHHFSTEAAKRDLGYAPISTDEGIARCREDLEAYVRTL